MKVLTGFLLAAAMLLSGCSTASYGTSSFRPAAPAMDGIAVPAGSLTSDQINAILATKFPPAKPVSLAIFYLVKPRYAGASDPARDYDPMPAIVAKLRASGLFVKVVPVPPFLLPVSNILVPAASIDAIQQIGIRTLSEYSLVLTGNAENVLFSYKSPLGNTMISSTLNVLLLDNRSSAIIATDKLFSEFQTPADFFSDKNAHETMEKLYGEQSEVLVKKLQDLFTARSN
jgi:hypothetical protein